MSAQVLSLNPPIGRAGGGDVGVSELWGAAGGGFLWVREVPWGFGRFVGGIRWGSERGGTSGTYGRRFPMVCLLGSGRGQQSCGRLRIPARAV